MNGRPRRAMTALAFLFLITALVWAARPAACAAAGPDADSSAARQVWTLERCLQVAQERNHQRPASAFTVAMAEAEHQQALSANWPQVKLQAAWSRMDEAPNFLFPAGQIAIPAQSIPYASGTTLVTIPANAFGPGFPPADVQMPVTIPGGTIDTPAGSMTVPAQDVKLMDPSSFLGSVNAMWPLFDGGLRSGYRQQARAQVAMSRQAARRTDLEVVESVRRLYCGAQLARRLSEVGGETLERMEATLDLTETMYKQGSGKVKKTDYLSNRVMVETIRATTARLDANVELAEAALAYAVGLGWDASIRPAGAVIPYEPFDAELTELVGTAWRFSPDWARFEAAVDAVRGKGRVARAGYLPKMALTGELHRWWNDYPAGMATARNKSGWTVGVGVELPLFDGFLTRSRVAEARAHLGQVEEQGILLREGIGLQVRSLVLGLASAERQYTATRDAMQAAVENCDLNTRAYQNELVETADVIQAQLVQALMTAQHELAGYEHATLCARLDLVVGTEVARQLQTGLNP